jgi:hypothetical protein
VSICSSLARRLRSICSSREAGRGHGGHGGGAILAQRLDADDADDDDNKPVRPLGMWAPSSGGVRCIHVNHCM